MTLPGFLGIGVPRGGSTWLHQLLDSHPDVYVPTRRKEIQFFDRYYSRGLSWYEGFFPGPEEAGRYKAIGEITPDYYRHEECPQRILEALPQCRLLIILRNPVDRLYSQYGFWVQRRGFAGSFEDFLKERPSALEFGYYDRHIRRYLRHFERERLLILVFERAVKQVEETRQRLAEFLELPASGFPPVSGTAVVNASTASRGGPLFRAGVRAANTLERLRLDRLVDFARRHGVERLLARGEALPPLDPAVRSWLEGVYRDDSARLEDELGVDLGPWRS